MLTDSGLGREGQGAWALQTDPAEMEGAQIGGEGVQIGMKEFEMVSGGAGVKGNGVHMDD